MKVSTHRARVVQNQDDDRTGKAAGEVSEFGEALWGSLEEEVTIGKDKRMIFTRLAGTEMTAWLVFNYFFGDGALTSPKVKHAFSQGSLFAFIGIKWGRDVGEWIFGIDYEGVFSIIEDGIQERSVNQ